MNEPSPRSDLPTSGVFAVLTLVIFLTHEVQTLSGDHAWLPMAWSAVLALMVSISAVQFVVDVRRRRRQDRGEPRP